MGCRVGSGERVTWWRERSRRDEWTGSAEKDGGRAGRGDRYESEREKRGVMRETGRLIHIRRQNSPKRLWDAKRLVQLSVCPTYCLSIVPTSPSLCTPCISISLAAMTNPPPYPPVVVSTVPPVAMSTTPPPPAPILEPVSSLDFLPLLAISPISEVKFGPE